MSLPIKFRRQARQELDEAAAWYDEQRVGLGRLFKDRVDEALDRISSMPELYGRMHGDVRRAGVRRFPYGVYYMVEPHRVVVIAVFHGSRDPREWQRRVDENLP